MVHIIWKYLYFFLEMKMISDKKISDHIQGGSTPDFLEILKIIISYQTVWS